MLTSNQRKPIKQDKRKKENCPSYYYELVMETKYTSHIYMLFADPKPVKNLFFFQALIRKKNSRKKTYASVTVTVVRDRKIRIALRTNQIAGFVTVPAWKKINTFYYS